MAVNPLPAPGGVLHLADSAFTKFMKKLHARAQAIPEVPNCTLALLREPYRFVLRTCALHGTEIFQSRLLFQRTVFLMGQDAAELVYNAELFMRHGAQPLRLQRTLFGRGGIQSLDSDEHRRRKAMFMALLASPERIHHLAALVGSELRTQAQAWPDADDVDLYAEMRVVLTRAACDWAGLPLAESEVTQRCRQLSAFIAPQRLFGPPHWQTWRHRRQTERWCARLVKQVRDGRLDPPDNSALAAVSRLRDSSGTLVSPRLAAVELLNVLRPVVAVSVYAVFIALALAKHSDYQERLQEDDPEFLQAFVQEVRRFYPFFPMVAARTRRRFDWKGYRFSAGLRVMLDLYATNHDVRLWETPDVFYPERFFRQEAGAFALVPQGGGDAYVHHRCPGEGITLAVMKEVAEFLCRDVSYDLASVEPELDWQRMPPLPRSPLLLANVRLWPAPPPSPRLAQAGARPATH